MGFFDKLKNAIIGGKEKADDTKDAAARANRTVDDTAERAKRAGDKAQNAVDDTAERAKRAGDKAKNAVDDANAASDELKKD